MRMLDSSDIVERKFMKETHRIIGEVQLHQYGNFLDKYAETIAVFEEKLQSLYAVKIKPVTVQTKPNEDITLLQLVHSDNKLLSRILGSLASICVEIKLLVTEAKDNFYNSFVYYGENEENNIKDLHQLSKLFDALQQVQFFLQRTQQVISLMLRQLCAILGKGLYVGSTSTSFPELLDCLAELLVTIITLESLLNTVTIKHHWAKYRRAVRSMSHNPAQFNIKHENIRALDKKLIDLESTLLMGTILQHVMENCLDESLLVATKNCNLANEIALYVSQLLCALEKDDENILFTQLWLQTNAMFILHYNLNGSVDKRMLKKLLEVNKKVSACIVSGNVLWYPEQFLVKLMPVISKQVDLKAIAGARSAQVAQRSQGLTKEAHMLCIQACHWIIQIEKIVVQDMSQLKVKHLHDICQLLLEGVRLIKKISEFIKWITNLHADEGRPMTKSVLLALCRLVEVLKCFQFIFHRNILPLSYVTLLISQHLTHKALDILMAIKKSFTQDKNYKEQQLDVLSAIVVAERALKGPNTTERILIAKLALSASGLETDNLYKLRTVINRLELMSNLIQLVNNLSNCSFLYWHQVLFPTYFTKLVDSRTDLMRSFLLLSALSDCVNSKPNIEKHLKNNLLQPLYQTVETNLRLQTHLHLQLPSTNPFQNILPQTFKKLFPLLYSDSYIDLKHEVEHYLNTMFYNLTTVVLHDWRTYGEMRQLAVLQYGLHTVDDNLPIQTLEQGLDVLEIMRNINVFVGKYLYNLNNQIFVEEWSSNKQLNTINISHVANSIRTHGIGIMSTTVNFTYQFLQNQFYTFSQFMFDEHIKSRLIKDLRFFSEHKNELNQMYPYERADKFVIDIRKLGLKDGLSYLDLFRKLITQIGNAMGYVRLIRSGGKRCVADASCSLPDLKAVDQLDEALSKQGFPTLTQHAANCFKRDVKNLVENFAEATEYFQLLIKVFAPAFRDAQNIHLRNFYAIIPPLTINFVQHALTCKEKLNKKNHAGAAFTDDGFAMGLAYIIELLDQGSQLNSLHWFQSVKQKHAQILKMNCSKDDVKLQQTQSLTEKRLNAFEMEFDLLYYNFSSARIFFQS